jgi:hypothetical protein
MRFENFPVSKKNAPRLKGRTLVVMFAERVGRAHPAWSRSCELAWTPLFAALRTLFSHSYTPFRLRYSSGWSVLRAWLRLVRSPLYRIFFPFPMWLVTFFGMEIFICFACQVCSCFPLYETHNLRALYSSDTWRRQIRKFMIRLMETSKYSVFHISKLRQVRALQAAVALPLNLPTTTVEFVFPAKIASDLYEEEWSGCEYVQQIEHNYQVAHVDII